jgi:hypothetical protein
MIPSMSFNDLLSISGAILLSLGGGATIVFALSKWLGNLWAGKILENEKSMLAREQELLVRRRNVYSKLAQSMRVFVGADISASPLQKEAFLSAYDEAALWASEAVVSEMSKFLDMLIQFNAKPPTVSQPALKAEYVHCITVMRRDCGFPRSDYQHRVVTF